MCMYIYVYVYVYVPPTWNTKPSAPSLEADRDTRAGGHAPHPYFTPPWWQPSGKLMLSLVNSHTNATRIGWHLWEIDFRFAHGLPPGWYH